jgi:hypothetical protein
MVLMILPQIGTQANVPYLEYSSIPHSETEQLRLHSAIPTQFLKQTSNMSKEAIPAAPNSNTK